MDEIACFAGIALSMTSVEIHYLSDFFFPYR